MIRTACLLVAHIPLSADSTIAVDAASVAKPNGNECTVNAIRSYAIVVSQRTRNDAQWKTVVEALRKKHNATVLDYLNSVQDTRGQLAKVFPKYVCFVAKPEEAGRDFVIAVHRLMRTLDDDPYTDAIWGILTGYEAKDALRIAQHQKPLLIRRAAAGCGLDLGAFEEGTWYSETTKNLMWEKKAGGKAEKKQSPDDTTKALVDLMNKQNPQFFSTSGHATHRDWQIGYSYKNGQFRCRNGVLVGISRDKKGYVINSPGPRVYSAAGNCLMGLIEDRQTMALAWMKSGGVHQMSGYVVSTWFGYGGWGVNDIFIKQQGRFTFAESFYVNNLALVQQLESRFPKTARVNFSKWNIETDRQIINKLARKHGLKKRDEAGLLWDRDTVAFYGDPAWEARVKRVREPAWKQSLTVKDNQYTFEVVTQASGKWTRPPAALLPQRIEDAKIVKGANLSPVVTDNFVLLPRSGNFRKGERHTIVFTAKTR